MRFPVLLAKSALSPLFSLPRLAPAIALFALLFFTPSLGAQTTWTGTSGTSWGTPGNWNPAVVPLASDDVVIPSTNNQPVILGGTAALAKSVTVQSGAILTVNNTGSLTIEGGSSGGLLNQGTVTVNTGGLLHIGLTVSPGQYGLVNQGTFNNAGQTDIDRTYNIGLWNQTGSYTNTGKTTIGAAAGTGSAGLYNQAVFQNNGGELQIDRFSNAGIHNLAGSSLTNTGKIAIGKTAATYGPGIYNFSTFHNNMGAELSIDRTSAGIDNRQHSSFINAGNIAIGGVASLNGPGVYNAAIFQNNGGEISIDRTYGGITSYDSSTVTNTGKITIGTKGKIPFNPGIFNYTFIPNPPYYATGFPVFNNNAGGEIIIDSTSNQAALHHGTGVFTNSGKITIGATLSINGPGLYNQAVFNNNSNSEIYIDGMASTGFGSALSNDANYNNTANSFTNSGKIVIGAAFGGGSSGVYNGYNSIFTNNSDGEISIDRINIQTYVFNGNTYTYSGNGLYNAYTFTNSGKITIGSAVNSGSQGLFHNSGVFTNNSGAEISIDHIFNLNFNSNGLYSNSTFVNSGKITIGKLVNGGAQGLFNNSTFNNNAGAEISIDHVDKPEFGDGKGLFNNSSFTNSGKIEIGSMASAGHHGLYNISTFNNNAGAEISIDHVRDTINPLNTHGLRNDNSFTNAGKITIGNVGTAGQWGLWNASTFNNNAGGEISVSRSDTCGLRNGSGYDNPTFTNSGKIVIGAAGSAGNYGLFNSATFNNDTCSARIEVLSDNIIVNPGAFSNAGTIVENAAGNSNITSNTGIVQNLNGGVFSIGSGNAAVTTPGYLDACSGVVISGNILWEHDGSSGVKDANVKLTGDTTATALTSLSGAYSFAVSTGSNFTITPTKNINKLNGLTVADATAIQQHAANIALLPAPYKRIAADVNKNNTINTLDASLITQALLGNPAALNQITSWRFVPTTYTFPNPNVPWGFPENIVLTGAIGNVGGQDFKGIKLGDVVSAWANPANFGAGEPLVLRTSDQVLEAGAELTAEFRADQLDDLASFQFALRFDPQQLQLLEIAPETSGTLPLTKDHFGAYNLTEGEIRVVWAQAASAVLEEGAPLFRLRFRALESGARLSEVLTLNQEALPAYAYNSVLAESGVEVHYVESTGTNHADVAAAGLQIQPNPFVEATTLAFTLPAETDAELRVLDATGRVLFSEKKRYAAGKHTQRLRPAGANGVLVVELVTPRGVLTRKIVAVKN